jgi:hypothetical protein
VITVTCLSIELFKIGIMQGHSLMNESCRTNIAVRFTMVLNTLLKKGFGINFD